MLRCFIHLLRFMPLGENVCSFCVRISLRFVASFQRTAADVGVFSVIMMF